MPAPVHPNAIIDLGERLMAEGIHSNSDVVRRRLCRDGVILALGAMIPLRRRNLTELDLERHLSRDSEAWRIAIPAAETKSRRPLVYRSPPRLTAHFDFYLAEVRPLYPASRCSTRLWLSGRGGGLGNEGLYLAITKHTEARLGRRLTPHQLRDSAASFIAEAYPEHIGFCRDLLGHIHHRTGERHYIAARGLSAGARYADALRADRDDPGVRRCRKHRRD